MFGNSPIRQPIKNNPNKELTGEQLRKNLEGKGFVGHSAFTRLRQQVGKYTGANKAVNTDTLKKFIKTTFVGKKSYQVNEFLKLRLKLNEAQRAKVIEEISPSGGLTREQQRMQERIDKVRTKDNIAEAQNLFAKSELNRKVSASKDSVGFAGQGNREQRGGQQRSGFASGPAGNVAPLTRTDNGPASGPANNAPSRPFFQP